MLIHKVYGLFNPYFRGKRFALFQQTIQPSPADTMLDLGGYAHYWTNFEPFAGRIDVLNIHEHEFDSDGFPDHNIHTAIGNGCDLDLADDSYDIVHSNSVIEHVGDYEAQKAFASEARRVAKKLWVQTPAKEFFFEPHLLTPFIHWLPQKQRERFVRFTLWALITRPGKEAAVAMAKEIQLLNHDQMVELFPDCEIRREKVLGMTKSYIAVRS